MFRKKPKPIIDFGQHRIRRQRRPIWRPRPRPAVDFGQHRLVQSRRQFLGWGAGVALFSGLLAYPFIRGKRREDQAADYSPTHRALTHALLTSTPDDELEMEVADYVAAAIFSSDDDDWVIQLRKLSPGFRAIYATMVLEGEVDNGGFSQFFFNSSGAIAYEARDGCWLIGARQHTQIVIDAIEIEMEIGTWGSRFPDSVTYRGDEGDVEYPDDYPFADFEGLDDRFYASLEDLSQLRIRFIRTHPDQFIGPEIG